jgi:uncharacterized protein (DUF1800 family)
MPLTPLTDQLGLKRAAHLLRRATFGAPISTIKEFADLTPAAAVSQLLRATLPDPLPPIDPLTGQAWGTGTAIDPLTGQREIILPAGEEDGEYQEYFKGWFIGQMMSAGIAPESSFAYAAREKIVLFLHTHFPAIQSKISNSCSLYFQNQLFRLFSRDGITGVPPEINFKELTVKISIDNAMLRLLDGDLNVKGSPNENYARELLELYSIGRGLEGSLPPSTVQGDYILYTEEDVQAAARVLSGWEVDDDFTTRDADTQLPRGRVRGSATNASGHDNDPKQFSARMNNAIIQGDPTLMPGGVATEESALDEIRQLIDLIYSKPETAKNICWKIYRFFVYAPHTPEASLAIDTNVITGMANTFLANNYKIQPVIEELLCSQHFYDAVTDHNEATTPDMIDDNFGGIIKSPIDLTLGMYSFFGVRLPDMTTQTEAFFEATASIVGALGNQGMNFYEPYDVAGYDAYHQYPIYHRAWITPNYLARRYDFAREVLMHSMDNPMSVDLYAFVKNNFTNAEAHDAHELIKQLAKYIFPVSDNLTFEPPDTTATLTAIRLNYFKKRFLQDLAGGSSTPEDYWTRRWDENPLDTTDLNAHLEFLFNAMMQSPEYQLA